MDDERYQIQWVQAIENDTGEVITEEVIAVEAENDESHHNGTQTGYIVHEITQIPNSLDQIAAENLIYMAQDGHVTSIDELIEESVDEDAQSVVDYADSQQIFECQVTEEVITDDWVQPQGEERVEIPVDQICGSRSGNNPLVEDIEVPLPTDQDEYTALRPYPCDFCSRRFRKKNSLMNHMEAHRNDRPNVCNLCGARYVRKSDLLSHLKTHASIPEEIEEIDTYLGDHTESHLSSKRMGYFENELIMENTKPKGRGRGGGRKSTKIKNEYHYSAINKAVQEQLPHIMENKYPTIDPRKPFVCQQCGIAFAREKALSSHVRIHGGDSPYECGTCNEMFWDLNTLNDHQKTHQFEISNSEYEPENDEESDSEDSKYGEYYCSVCGMSFHRQDLLKRHTKTHIKTEILPDNDSTRHCCNVCGETFIEALDLLAHAEVHARFQPFKCTLCGEAFLEESTIKKHLINVHSEEMTANSCRLCGKECKDSKALMKHSWDHSREKNHSCSKCGKNFHNKARLKRHMVSHRNKSVTCEICKEEFPDGRSLMNHRHSHNNAPGKQFPCHECGKTFGSRSSQQIHVRIHTGEKPYGCRYCWKAFADGGTLRKHERIHTGEKPYACSVCVRAFNQRVVLREHIRAHHSALDTSRGVYYCQVCNDILPNSTELIQHLIHHSDMNTAMQRQPVTGPRKYKRRRKLKPHEIIKLRHEKPNNAEDIDYSDIEMTPVDDLLGINNKNKKRSNYTHQSSTSGIAQSSSSRHRKYSGNSDKSTTINWRHKLMSPTTTDDTYNGVFQNLENALNNIDSLVVNTSTNPTASVNSLSNIPATATTTVTPSSTTVTTTKSNKTVGRRRGNKTTEAQEKSSRPKMIHTQKTRVATDFGSKRKTRTLITRTEPIEIDNNVIQQKDSSFPVIKQEQPSQSDLFDAQLLLEAASIRKDSEKYNSDLLNDLEDILRSPIKSKSSSKRKSTNQKSYDVIESSIDVTDNQVPLEIGPIQQECTPKSIKEIKKQQSLLSSSSPSSNKIPDEDLRRSTRSRRPTIPNKKYLEYEMTSSISSKSNAKQQSSIKIKEETPEKPEIHIKTEEIDDSSNSPEKIAIENPIIKTEPYHQCDMCCAVFQNRDQLYNHISIHI